MDIASLGICRANHKIYEKLRINGLGRNSARVIYKDENGGNLPCKLFCLGDDEFVAVTPDLPRPSAHYFIAAVTREGLTVDFSEHSIDFDVAKWQSRLNYRLHKELCSEIRCYDESHTLRDGSQDFELTDIISCPDHLQFRMVFTFPGEKSGDLRLRIQDENLSVLADSFVALGNVREMPEGPGAEGRHQIAVSVKLPWDIDDITINAWESKRPGIQIQTVISAQYWSSIQKQKDTLYFNNAGVDPYYPEWFRLHRATPYQLSQQRKVTFGEEPLFSVIVPLYKTPVNLFEEMISSLRSQTYPKWECILVNSTPKDAELKEHINEVASIDARVKVIELQENLGISLNTNAGQAAAKGDFICFFDHDDIIEPNLLFEYAKAINNHSDVDLLYCDEDKLLPDGTLTSPSFKSDFDLDHLRSNNYICHMLCIRKTLLDTLIPNTADNDGAQDHNITLQAAEKARYIHHVPHVLYHWRVTENSTSGNAGIKPYAITAGIKAVKAHLERVGEKGTVTEGAFPFCYRVTYAVPENKPLVSIVIPNKDHIDLLDRCLSSIEKKSTYSNYEIIVVENNSTEDSTFAYYDGLASHPRIRVIHWNGTGFNYSQLINFGRGQSRGEYLLLLNNDTEVITPDWIEQLLGNCARPNVGAVGARLYYPDETVQHAGVILADDAAHFFQGLPRDNPGGYFHLSTVQRGLSAVTGACMMVGVNDFDAVGGYDPSFAVSYNDVDFCLKLRKAGKLIVYTPWVELYHYESVSRGRDESGSARTRYFGEKALMMSKWADVFSKPDPYFNPNLRQTIPDACYYRF